MFKKWLAAVSTITISAIYWLSLERKKYVREYVHKSCNNAISGFFNKTVTSEGWKCSQGGQVLHTVNFKASMIPSPVEVTVLLVSVVFLTGVIYMTYNYRGEYGLEEKLENLKDKTLGELGGD